MAKKILSVGIITSIVFAFIFVGSCDKTDSPFMADRDSGTGIGADSVVRKILIYDFTGHACGNCPRAHRVIKNIKNVFGDVIVPVAIHATFFARPQNNPDGSYSYDFRTEIGDILGGRDFSTDCYYGALNLPVGLVNSLAPASLSPDAEWSIQVQNYIDTEPEFEINIFNSYCSSGENVITIINIKTLIENQRNLYLNAFIIEDGIVQWQTDYEASPSDVENYGHDHVLRGGFIDAFGTSINANNILNPGQTILKEFTHPIDEEWIKENCSVVAFVYDYDTKEVLQAEIKEFR